MLQSLLAALRARKKPPESGRRSKRLFMGVPARMRAADTVGAKWEQVMLDNLSLGGARVKTATQMSLRSAIDLKVPLGAAGEIPVRASVVHARRKRDSFIAEYGLRFVDLSYDRYRVLIEYMNERDGASAAGLRQPGSKRA